MNIKYLSIIFLIISIQIHAKEAELKEVFVVKAQKSILTNETLYPAAIESRVQSQVKPQYNSIIQEIVLPLGSKVSKGQKILKISNQDSSFNYRDSYILAPVDGVISWYGIKKGSYVSVNDTLVVITDPSNLFFKIHVPVKDIGNIVPGQQATFKSESLKQPLELKVVGVGAIVETVTGTVAVELAPEKKHKLTSGLMGKVEFKTESIPLFLVKDSAVKMIGSETYIQLLENDLVKKVKIKLGEKTDGRTVVLEGLQEGQVYIERSSGYVAEGDKVKVTEKI